MAAETPEFGAWHTATDGTAHYVLKGKSLCGAKIKANAPPPVRSAKSTAIVTPMCEECLDRNAARWAGEHGMKAPVPLQPQRSYWWRQLKRKKK